MREIIFGLICVIGVLLVGNFATRLNRRTFPQRPKTSLKGASIASAAALGGFVVGVFIVPVSLIPENQYVRVILAIGITIVLGSIELAALKKLSGQWLNEYLLDRDVFPFLSLGFACSIILKPYFV